MSSTPDNFTRKEDYCGWKGDESECGFLERVIKLESPVECRGAQGLWDVPAEIAALIADAIPDDG